MTYRGFLSRSDIGLRAPRSRSTNITPQNGGSAGHHGGPSQNITNHDQCLSKWRGWQNYHMDKHGWVDIAYTLGVCDHGYILAGRGAGVRTAANGTNYGNQNYYAICWIGGKDETPTQDARDAFWVAVEMLKDQGNAGNSVKRHSDFKATSCPGELGNVIDDGPQDTVPTPEPEPQPEPQPKPEPEPQPKPPKNWTENIVDNLPLLKKRTNLAKASDAERRAQGLLAAAGVLEIAPNLDGKRFDGKFGSSTDKAVRAFQSKKGLTVDGVIGKNTWTALLGV